MRIAIALALAAAAAACQRAQPSPEYREARDRHAALLARAPLDASAQPEMGAVLELLERVPPGSLDAEPAAELRRRIQEERRAAAEEQARRARLVEDAGAPTPLTGGGAAPEAAAASPEAQPETGPRDRAPSALAAGTPLEEFQRTHGDCFEARAPARFEGPGEAARQGVAWGLRDDEGCRARHPAEVGRLVLFADGKLEGVRDEAGTRSVAVTRRVEGGGRRPDGSVVLPEGVQLPPGATARWEPAAPAAAAPATRR